MARRKPERTYYGNLSVSPNAVHYYLRPADGFTSTSRHRANQICLEENSHNGKVSDKARKKLECCLQWLLYSAKNKKVVDVDTGKTFFFKINFITLTLSAPQVHSDQEITNRCLGNFLDTLKKQCGVVNYLWRAEAQANGNIHYHVVTDKYIHHSDIRRYWNQSQQLLGYIDSFCFSKKHRNPNSTDIHSVKHVKRLSSYLSKYMAKNRAFGCIGELRLINGKQVEVLYGSKQYKNENADQKKGRVIGHVLGGLIRPIECRLWGCNRELSKRKSIVVSEDEYVFSDLASIIKQCEFRQFKGEYVTSLYGDFKKACDFLLSA